MTVARRSKLLWRSLVFGVRMGIQYGWLAGHTYWIVQRTSEPKPWEQIQKECE